MPGYNEQRLVTANTLPNLLVVLFVIRVVLLLIVLFCVLFAYKCVLPPGVNPIAVDKYININYRGRGVQTEIPFSSDTGSNKDPFLILVHPFTGLLLLFPGNACHRLSNVVSYLYLCLVNVIFMNKFTILLPGRTLTGACRSLFSASRT
jgi:hypothetical protein